MTWQEKLSRLADSSGFRSLLLYWKEANFWNYSNALFFALTVIILKIGLPSAMRNNVFFYRTKKKRLLKSDNYSGRERRVFLPRRVFGHENTPAPTSLWYRCSRLNITISRSTTLRWTMRELKRRCCHAVSASKLSSVVAEKATGGTGPWKKNTYNLHLQWIRHK